MWKKENEKIINWKNFKMRQRKNKFLIVKKLRKWEKENEKTRKLENEKINNQTIQI